MSISTAPHLNFRGEARRALEFSRSVVGVTISIATDADIHLAESASEHYRVAFGRVAGQPPLTLLGNARRPVRGHLGRGRSATRGG